MKEISIKALINWVLAALLLASSLVFSIGNNNAFAQTSCTLPTDFGSITHSVQPQSSATYNLWVRLWVPSGATRSAKVNLNDICKDLPVPNAIAAGAWVWVNSGADGTALRTALTGGTGYQMVIAGASGGVRVDRVLLLSDTCVPTDFGDNCTTTDTTAPDISISSPANGATVSGFVNVAVNVSDSSDVKSVELLVNGSSKAQSTTAPYSMSWDSRTVSDGAYDLRARVTDPSGNTNLSSPVTVNVLNTRKGGSSRIPIDSYKDGGQGVGYNDTTAGNLGDGTCRNDDVDLKVGENGSCVLGWFATGEWLEYNVNVATAGTYTFRTYAASGDSDGGALRLEVNGNNVSGTVAVPTTGSFTQFTTVDAQVELPAGNVSMRFVNESQYFDVAWLEFWGPGAVTLGSVDPTPPPSEPPADVVSLISADAYNNGGQNVGYFDTTAGNFGDGTCRNDDVDMKAGTDGTCTIGWFANGEWLEYDVSVGSEGEYTFQVNASRGSTGDGRLHLELNGNNVSGDVLVPSTGSWDSFSVINTTVQLPAGDHTLRLVSDLQYFDVDWMQFVGPGTVTLRDNTTTDPAPDTTPPSQPTNLNASLVTQDTVVLNWSPSVDTGFGVVGYAVYRNGELLEAVITNSYTDQGLEAGTSYLYEVSALDGAGNESVKSKLTVNTLDTTPPPGEPKTADLNEDNLYDSRDLAIYKGWYKANDLQADYNDDGALTVSDWAIFLGLWKQGV